MIDQIRRRKETKAGEFPKVVSFLWLTNRYNLISDLLWSPYLTRVLISETDSLDDHDNDDDDSADDDDEDRDHYDALACHLPSSEFWNGV